MVGGTYILVTFFLALMALVARPVRRWLRSRQKPRRTIVVLGVAWLVGLIVLASAFPGPPPEPASAAQQVQVTSSASPGSNSPVSTSPASAGTTSAATAGRCLVRFESDQPLPDPSCTPGVTNPAVTTATLGTTICTSGWTAVVRPAVSFTEPIKLDQIPAYGYADTNPADYEEDHLIPLELGGAPADPKNLWPEPGAIPNPKDKVEDALKTAVCARRIDLVAAQQAIATDWTTAEQVLGLTTTTTQAPPPVPAPTERQDPTMEQQQQDPLAGRYHAGEFCKKADLGETTTATNGATITCERDGNYYRWMAG